MSEFTVPKPENDPIRSYAPGTEERKELRAKLNELKGREIEIPLIIGGKEVKTGNMGKCVIPHNHSHVLAHFHKTGESEVTQAIDAAAKAWKIWSTESFDKRAQVFLKMGELAANKYRQTLNASTMLNMSKTVYQAEIDSACEVVDFFNFNPEMFYHISITNGFDIFIKI